ncbi:MAG: AbrB/MazE/SpoVT family DNA-binding domain-containing protein [Oscillospiraceae bacterium]
MGEYETQSTGLVRKVDSLRHIVLPIELRRSLELEEKDSLDIREWRQC